MSNLSHLIHPQTFVKSITHPKLDLAIAEYDHALGRSQEPSEALKALKKKYETLN